MQVSEEHVSHMIKENMAPRKDYLGKNNIEAYRLFHSEYGDLPLAIDIYRDHAVISIFEPTEPENLRTLESALKKTLNVQDFFYKNRTKVDTAQPAEESRTPHKEITVTEYGNIFSINLSDYLDTGLFLDHRETRRWIGERSKNKTVLNTFAYTGSFSIYAAKGGALKTHSVDLSKTYCEWIKKNLVLNNMSPEKNWVYKMDTFEFYKYARRKKLSFDIIIIDPPTFSRNKGAAFSVQKDHPRLINEALSLLNPGGFILFSNNYRGFILKEEKISRAKIQERQDLIPPDFKEIIPHRCFIITPQ